MLLYYFVRFYTCGPKTQANLDLIKQKTSSSSKPKTHSNKIYLLSPTAIRHGPTTLAAIATALRMCSLHAQIYTATFCSASVGFAPWIFWFRFSKPLERIISKGCTRTGSDTTQLKAPIAPPNTAINQPDTHGIESLGSDKRTNLRTTDVRGSPMFPSCVLIRACKTDIVPHCFPPCFPVKKNACNLSLAQPQAQWNPTGAERLDHNQCAGKVGSSPNCYLIFGTCCMVSWPWNPTAPSLSIIK